MPNDIIPKPTVVDQLVEKLNLPELIGGPAGKAISRLIGEIADIPSVWIQRYTQAIKDGTEARRTVSQALAAEIAKGISADKELIERATEVMLAKEVRNQANREAVAQKALEYLSDDDIKNTTGDVDDDWMNVFSQHAENASSERLREIWGRVLAGEIRKPKSFSLKTLRFIAELDQNIAQLFQKYSDKVVANTYIFGQRNEGSELQELLQLEDFGLVTGVAGTLHHTPTIPESGWLVFPFNKKALHVIGTPGTKLQIPAIVLTRVGREVAQVLNTPDDIQAAKEVADIITKQNLSAIHYIELVPVSDGFRFRQLEVLWEKPPSE